jgi:hypothetical protein
MSAGRCTRIPLAMRRITAKTRLPYTIAPRFEQGVEELFWSRRASKSEPFQASCYVIEPEAVARSSRDWVFELRLRDDVRVTAWAG